MNTNTIDLTLLLLYLCGWEEESRNRPGERVFRAWKGLLFEVLNKLADEKLIVQFADAKSVTLTEAGINKARQLKDRFFSGKGGAHEKW
jgi:hypothetical protein